MKDARNRTHNGSGIVDQSLRQFSRDFLRVLRGCSRVQALTGDNNGDWFYVLEVAVPSSNSAPTSALPSARTRSRYQTTIVTSENTKIMVETALISGVIPRRSRPQISSGSVLSRPMRKKLTAISSIESVKISSAAPMIGSFRFGTVMSQNVCQ